jgi:glycerol kinase
VPVLASRTPDATALGVAALARLAQGETGSPPAEVELTVHPVMSTDEAAERLSRYSHALASALS